ncbi:MAG: ATP-dependent helicase/nuclease subunit A [Polaribacter sp.]|jgi:ATP-dependent helicase/nuclease subunit A
MPIKIISAGAGSGKTYRLTEEMVALLEDEKSGVRANGIIATTFTNKAAAELQERVRVRLLEKGMAEKANELTNALIGTVHGLGVKLLKRFAFEAGVSPEVDIIADEDQQVLFNKSLAAILTEERIIAIQQSSERLGMTAEEADQWRKLVKDLTDVARSNDFSIPVLEKSKKLSYESFLPLLGEPSVNSPEFFNERLLKLLTDAVTALENNTDETKVTLKGKNDLKNQLNNLQLRGELNWQDWVRIGKVKVGAKSREAVEELKEFAETHDEHPKFHADIQDFINQIFDIAILALEEYDRYKKQRGLIDYVDMETLVKRLLDNSEVREVLHEEIDLLMVDEFQDTSPIQLDIFLKLSQIVPHSIWVGDPKQSIYGFRGADPKLMQEIINENGIKKENILEHSWRSREDVVNLTNALFVKAFPELPKERVMLRAKRTKAANPNDEKFKQEPLEMQEAIQHWHFEFGEGRMPGKPWMENCLANSIQSLLLERGVPVLPKGASKSRPIIPGDIAVLCRSNKACQDIADALHRTGLKAAIARMGLLNTAESKLILACLKFILHSSDSLSIAEILLLAANMRTEEIIEDRLEYLKEVGELPSWEEKWAEGNGYIERLNSLREEARDLSGAEILDLLLEELNLRRIIATWGKTDLRMANVDMLRHYALKYESACNRLHIAASLGGFLLWLSDLEGKGLDQQGSGEGSDAVNVLTYHKSKGLEWPAVICYDLEGTLRENTYGLKIVPESDEIDLRNLLGNRWVRFWINPYGKQSRNTRLEQRMQQSEAFAEAKTEALAEEARLLYVGITRARDYLIFPTREKSTNWLNRVWHAGQEDHPTIDKDDAETPWEWEGKIITKATDVNAFERDFGHTELEEEKVTYLEERKGTIFYQPYYIDLKKENSNNTATYGSPVPFATVPIVEEEEQIATAKLLQAMLMGDHPELESSYRESMAESVLDRFSMEQSIPTKTLQDYSKAFYDKIKANWAPTKIIKHYPIRYREEGRRLETVLDMVLETKSGLVLIHLDGSSGKQKSKSTKEAVAILQYAKSAVAQDYGQMVTEALVGFTMLGEFRGI